MLQNLNNVMRDNLEQYKGIVTSLKAQLAAAGQHPPAAHFVQMAGQQNPMQQQQQSQQQLMSARQQPPTAHIVQVVGQQPPVSQQMQQIQIQMQSQRRESQLQFGPGNSQPQQQQPAFPQTLQGSQMVQVMTESGPRYILMPVQQAQGQQQGQHQHQHQHHQRHLPFVLQASPMGPGSVPVASHNPQTHG